MKRPPAVGGDTSSGQPAWRVSTSHRCVRAVCELQRGGRGPLADTIAAAIFVILGAIICAICVLLSVFRALAWHRMPTSAAECGGSFVARSKSYCVLCCCARCFGFSL